MNCPVCFDDTASTTRSRQLECGHTSCVSCLRRWFATEETTGQASPTCPVETCRRAVGPDVSQSILGRAFVAAGSQRKKRRRDNVDARTQRWLDQNTLECGGCQTPLFKSSGCDKLQCLCGYRICWRCKTPGAACFCNVGHGFVDNVTGQPAFGPTQQATKEELKDLKGFLQKKQQQRPIRSSLQDYFLPHDRKRPRLFSPMLRFPDPLLFSHNRFLPPTRLASAGMDFASSSPPSSGPQQRNNPLTSPTIRTAVPRTPPTTSTTEQDDLLRALQLSRQSMTQFEKDLEQAIQWSLDSNRKRKRHHPSSSSWSGATAFNPVRIADDRKLAPQTGNSATDPVCLDDDDDDSE
jgi:Ring finger domain